MKSSGSCWGCPDYLKDQGMQFCCKSTTREIPNFVLDFPKWCPRGFKPVITKEEVDQLERDFKKWEKSRKK